MKIIELRPGDKIQIIVKASGNGDKPGITPVQDLEGRTVLPVPYISQNGPGADHAPGDCGPACVAMVVHYLTDNDPTVNAVSLAGGVQKDARWSSLQQNAKAARFYGLKARNVRPLTPDAIVKEIKAGFPVMALVKYDLLSTAEDPNQSSFKGAHFVLLVGFSPKTVILHDPNRISGDEFGAFRELSWSVFNKAHGSTDKTPGNSYNNHGITFDV